MVLNKLTELSLKYGPAWVVTIQLMGTITYWIIFALLYAFNLNPVGIAKYFNLADISEESLLNGISGYLALAFGLNRMLAPLRIGLALLIVPRIADRMNAFLKPWLIKFGLKDFVAESASSPSKDGPPPLETATSPSVAAAAAAKTTKKDN